MTTFTINVTDLMDNFWTLKWTPASSKNKNLTEADIQETVNFIKTGNWGKSATTAAKNCYDTLASLIAEVIIDDSWYSRERIHKIILKITRAYYNYSFSKKGDDLYHQLEKLAEKEKSPKNTIRFRKLLKKIIKSENLFAVKFADDENWLIDITTKMKCCICGQIIDDEYYSHNPYPVRHQSFPGEKENRCCSLCNQQIVIPSRILFGRNSETHRIMMEMDYEDLLDAVK